MRQLLSRAWFLALVLAVVPAASAAAEGGTESVTLRGRVLRADGSPFANQNVSVEASKPGAFGSGTGGSDHYSGRTDANGNYSFTFLAAKEPGKQTDTDYYFRAQTASTVNRSQQVEIEYELELLTPVHNAPDIQFWDPAFSVRTTERDYVVEFPVLVGAKNTARAFIGDTLVASARTGTSLDRRSIQDASVEVTPYANRDVSTEGTIYHQRFTTTRAGLKGSLVPLSRGRSCVAATESGEAAGSCARLTDGNLTADPNQPADFSRFTATIDLGSVQNVGDARGCGCSFQVSVNGTDWTGVVASGSPARYVRAKGYDSSTPELSVWPPWNVANASVSPVPRVRPTPLATVPATPLETVPPTTAAPPTTTAPSDEERVALGPVQKPGVGWPIKLVGVFALLPVAHLTLNRVQEAMRSSGGENFGRR